MDLSLCMYVCFTKSISCEQLFYLSTFSFFLVYSSPFCIYRYLSTFLSVCLSICPHREVRLLRVLPPPRHTFTPSLPCPSQPCLAPLFSSLRCPGVPYLSPPPPPVSLSYKFRRGIEESLIVTLEGSLILSDDSFYAALVLLMFPRRIIGEACCSCGVVLP